MNIIETDFENLFVIELLSFKDNRGEFVKTINDASFSKRGLNWRFTESFYSVSQKDVIRGMHFQMPPDDHEKLVYVITGAIIDVIVDLRTGSSTYGKFYNLELSAENRKAIYIGKGFAHGFLALQENTIVEYHTTTSQVKESESGILWNSFGFNWPLLNPILSDRDRNFPGFVTSKKYFS